MRLDQELNRNPVFTKRPLKSVEYDLIVAGDAGEAGAQFDVFLGYK